MVFSTNSGLSYIYLQYESQKVHGLFGLGWKNQEHTVEEVIKRFTSWEISVLASMSDPKLVESTYFGYFILIAKNMKKRFQKGNHIRMTFEV